MTAVIPVPHSVAFSGGAPFVLRPDTTISVPPGNEEAARVARDLSAWIGTSAGPEPPRVETTGSTEQGRIRLVHRGSLTGESYELDIAAGGITIAAGGGAGFFYGVQTLRQLLPPAIEYKAARADENRVLEAPAARITDRPRFEWRGAMLDVSRHFLSVDEVKRFIDLMALHKLNRLHLHLSDDQGWRIEISSWPNLTAYGGSTQVGGGPGGFYTQRQYADIVSYAGDRFVMIVPEIDVPGHTNAALASYAELNGDGKARALYTGTEVGLISLPVGKPSTYRFIDDVVREIAAITPGPYFHVGGDEVRTLTAPEYIAFIDRVQAIVRSHGKQTIGWDETAAANLLPATLVQHWRPDGLAAEAVAKGAKVIMSPPGRIYLDMKYNRETALGLRWAGCVEVKDSYEWDPATVVPGVPEASVAGVEAPLWSETLATIRDVEFMAFPRLAAAAEIGWSREDGRSWDEFKIRLGAQARRWTALGVNFYRSPGVPWKD
jgi:hexosaminidase